MVKEKNGRTIYVGTELGIYRGHLPPEAVIQPSLVGRNTIFNWTWTRSPGVPNVRVMDIDVHQGPQFRNPTGIVRAATFGRGVFELRRSTTTVTPADRQRLKRRK